MESIQVPCWKLAPAPAHFDQWLCWSFMSWLLEQQVLRCDIWGVTTGDSLYTSTHKNANICSEQSSKILNCYIQISDAQMAVSSLSHSRASELWHQTNIHDIIKFQENKTRSDPTNSSTLHTKQLQCKICKNTAFKCLECVPSLDCYAIMVSVYHYTTTPFSNYQNETMGPQCETHCEQSRNETWVMIGCDWLRSHPFFIIPSTPDHSFYFLFLKLFSKYICWTFVYLF